MESPYVPFALPAWLTERELQVIGDGIAYESYTPFAMPTTPARTETPRSPRNAAGRSRKGSSPCTRHRTSPSWCEADAACTYVHAKKRTPYCRKRSRRASAGRPKRKASASR